MKNNLLKTIFTAVALGLGVATVVLNMLGNLTASTAISTLSLGLTCLAIAALQK
jgi:hypothetical protein